MACVNPPGFSSWPRRLGVQGVQDDSANVELSHQKFCESHGFLSSFQTHRWAKVAYGDLNAGM